MHILFPTKSTDCLQGWKVVAAEVANLFLWSGDWPVILSVILGLWLNLQHVNPLKNDHLVTWAARFKLVHTNANCIASSCSWLQKQMCLNPGVPGPGLLFWVLLVVKWS